MLNQTDPLPPPVRPTNWPMILGWTAVIGMTIAVFNGTINLSGGKVRANRRRSSRRVRRNAGTQNWYRSGGLYRQGNWAWDGSDVEARGNLLWWSSVLHLFSPVAENVTLDEANEAIHKTPQWTWDAPKPNAGRRSSHTRPKPAKMSDLGVWKAIGTVRDAHPREHLNVLPPGVAAKFKKLPPGLYKYGYGPKNGEVITQFKKATLKGAMTSTRIGASKVGEYHWLVDNFDPKFPVVVRGIDDHGHTYFRIEEYIKPRVRETVSVRRTSKVR